MRPPTRRDALRSAGAALLVGAAGCLDGSGADDGTEPHTDAGTEPDDSTATPDRTEALDEWPKSDSRSETLSVSPETDALDDGEFAAYAQRKREEYAARSSSDDPGSGPPAVDFDGAAYGGAWTVRVGSERDLPAADAAIVRLEPEGGSGGSVAYVLWLASKVRVGNNHLRGLDVRLSLPDDAELVAYRPEETYDAEDADAIYPASVPGFDDAPAVEVPLERGSVAPGEEAATGEGGTAHFRWDGDTQGQQALVGACEIREADGPRFDLRVGVEWNEYAE